MHREEDRARELLSPAERWERDEKRAQALAQHQAATRPDPAPPTKVIPTQSGWPFVVGQIIPGARVVAVVPQLGTLVDIRRPKK